MKLKNLLQMNDWEIKTFLNTILAIQLAFWGVIGLDLVGLQIPIIRQLIVIVYLVFIPGVIILRILNLHKLGSIETILYSVGLSIGTLMLMGLTMNTVFPYFAVYRPISMVPLMITISAIVLLLCILCYFYDRNFSDPDFIEFKYLLSPSTLFLCLLPFIASFGRLLFNFYDTNIFFMLTIIIIASIVISIGFNQFIPIKSYPLAILGITIALLINNSLISKYIWGWDIHIEYYLSNLVINNSRWDSMIQANTNAMLSITMLAPIFVNLSGMSLTWVFKIIYPLLFSLVPLCLYRVFQRQTNEDIAFFSCFFFISIYTFYTEMLSLARQQIAELFFSLLILLMISNNINKMKKSFLTLLFSILLVVSHYSLSYIFMMTLVVGWSILILSKNAIIQKLVNDFYSKFICRNNNNNLVLLVTKKDASISFTFITFFVVFALMWYIYNSDSSPFNRVILIGNHILSSIHSDFLSPDAVEALKIASTKSSSALHQINKIINYLNQFLIIIGVSTLFISRKMRFVKEYAVFSIVNLFVLFAALSVPYFSSALNLTRIYHITLIFLAPFCIIGGMTALKKAYKKIDEKRSLTVLSVYFAIFFLFQIGFVYQTLEGSTSSISLNNTVDMPKFNELEVLGANWLYNVKNNDDVYADNNKFNLLESLEWKSTKYLPINTDLIAKNSYVYFGSSNVFKNEILVKQLKGVSISTEYINADNIITTRKKIYSNGGVEIYY